VLKRFLAFVFSVAILKNNRPSRYSLPETNTLLRIFGPQLFDACLFLDPEFVIGRCFAFGALSRLILTRSAQPIERIYLSTYYNLVHQVCVAYHLTYTARVHELRWVLLRWHVSYWKPFKLKLSNSLQIGTHKIQMRSESKLFVF
jgi:hypothetical protein